MEVRRTCSQEAAQYTVTVTGTTRFASSLGVPVKVRANGVKCFRVWGDDQRKVTLPAGAYDFQFAAPFKFAKRIKVYLFQDTNIDVMTSGFSLEIDVKVSYVP